ncbi:SDR family NAD(P)-dependent oxidoreductase [Streptomyces sp. P6-2-1]|uniref:SDR family NAD(P)-dependent oxidoreductase n=1 Tax=unclassified Streptomyces TaxID=2593676 RepID=UPI003D36C0B9
MTTPEKTAPRPRTVLVTGAGTGIGRATARAFAAEGARVWAVGRGPGPLAGTAEGTGGAVVPLAVDITAPDGPARIAAAVAAETPYLDVLVHNAGIVRAAALADLDPAAVRAQTETNLLAPAFLTQALLPSLRASGAGVVLNVTTSVDGRAWPGSSVYAATKAGLESLTRSWAVELAPLGIRVCAVAPGAVGTPIGEHQGLSAARRAALRSWQLAHTPLGRLGRPEEIAWALTRLAGHDAAFVTGAVWAVDGGAVVA